VQKYESAGQLAHAVSPEGLQLISVDGFHASGKTTLARALGAAWQRRVVSADDYLIRNQGTFFASLRLADLAAALVRGPVIFEGVCAQQILEALGIQPDLMIYIKRMAMWGWADDPDLDNDPLEGPIDPLQAQLRTLWEEVATYHRRYMPQASADVCVERSLWKAGEG
jgi:hypothetical protein